MRPVGIEHEQSEQIPVPHRLIVIAANQEPYLPLPVAALACVDGSWPIVSRWTLTPDERARIAAGEDLYLQIFTFGNPLQPLLPTVGLADRFPKETETR